MARYPQATRQGGPAHAAMVARNRAILLRLQATAEHWRLAPAFQAAARARVFHAIGTAANPYELNRVLLIESARIAARIRSLQRTGL